MDDTLRLTEEPESCDECNFRNDPYETHCDGCPLYKEEIGETNDDE